MNHRMKKYEWIIKNFHKIPKDLQYSIIKRLPPSLVKCICEICLNLIRGNVNTSNSQKQQLAKYKRIIRRLAQKSNNTSSKRKLLMSGKGIPLIPILFSVVSSLLTKIIG